MNTTTYHNCDFIPEVKDQSFGEWQDIDSAPIDCDILVKCDNFGDPKRGFHFAVVRWNEDYSAFYDANIDYDDDDIDLDSYGAYMYATHWMPLPQPPKEIK